MSDGIYVALSGALGESEKLDVVATNLANASTAGYQRLRPVFHEALAQAQSGAASFQHETTSATTLDSTRGALRVTGRPLDVALPDASYLALTTARGERYTRAGSLSLATDGTLQTTHGDPIASENGRPIRAAADQGEVSLSPAGEVWQNGSMLGRAKVVTFAEPSRLVAEGGTVLAATVASGAPTAATGKLEIGTVEESNTSVVGSMTELVSASRAFDAFQKAIEAFHQADQKVTTTVPDADQ
jgi:flagellar basal body rod protein FlgG